MKWLLVAVALILAGCSRTEESPVPQPAAPIKAARSATSAVPMTTTAPAAPVVTRASSGALDACSLISVDDLKRITGSAFKAGVNSTSQPDVMRCTFPREGGGGIGVVLHLRDAAAEYRSMTGMAPVPGIADEAWWSPEVTTFVGRKGSQVLVVGFNFTGGDQKKWAEDIVRVILPKL